MPDPKDGEAGTAIEPLAAEEPTEADEADPGKTAEFKAQQRERGEGKYGSTPERPFEPLEDEEGSWIEIELVGEDDEPVPGARYRIELPDGSFASGSLDENGVARVEGFEAGTCKICFPDLDEEAWEEA